MSSRHDLLSVEQMAACDRATVKAGTPGTELMQRAGAAVAAEIALRWARRPLVVLCGPGNNGGDGFVIARVLAGQGWPVRVALLGMRERLTGDAAAHAQKWQGAVEPLEPTSINGAELVVDAVFGAGLSRAIGDDLGQIFATLAKRGVPVVAVDVPSGVHGDTGEALGNPPEAALTVTFCRKKPGHLLLPGRALCGEIVVADIGISEATVDAAGSVVRENAPDLWKHLFPKQRPDWHKYSRGHAVIAGGAHMTGAARLAARAAMRVGAGIVTLASPADMVVHYMGWLPHVVVKPVRDTASFAEMIGDRKASAALVGPGNGLTGGTRERALAALKTRKPCVLDADALSVFEHTFPLLQGALHENCVLTPHDGEFQRLFTERAGGRLQRAQAAAKQSGAVVLYKGFDTVIAHPDGRATINSNAPAGLATAGAGDVLAGMVVGLQAQGMPAFEAAAAATWLHAEAAASFGPGLVSDDLPELIPGALRHLL